MELTAGNFKSKESALLPFLKGVQIFSGADKDSFSKLLSKSQLKNFSKGKLLLINDEPSEFLYVIISGWVKLFRETLNGDEAIIDILSAGDVFGETAIFHEMNSPYSAQIVEDVELLMIPLDAFAKQVNGNQAFALGVLSAVSRQNRQKSKEVEHLTVMNAPQRIGCFLLRLCIGKNPDKPAVLHLPYDKTLIAARLGMQPETFSRALSTLKKQTGIDISGPTVTIGKLSQLTEFCCGACSDSFPCRD